MRESAGIFFFLITADARVSLRTPQLIPWGPEVYDRILNWRTNPMPDQSAGKLIEHLIKLESYSSIVQLI